MLAVPCREKEATELTISLNEHIIHDDRID
jgi:hypothetical protein